VENKEDTPPRPREATGGAGCAPAKPSTKCENRSQFARRAAISRTPDTRPGFPGKRRVAGVVTSHCRRLRSVRHGRLFCALAELAVELSPAISRLGAFPTPVFECVAGLVIRRPKTCTKPVRGGASQTDPFLVLVTDQPVRDVMAVAGADLTGSSGLWCG
jgi:hypothetical protein